LAKLGFKIKKSVKGNYLLITAEKPLEFKYVKVKVAESEYRVEKKFDHS
jgi:hypothetical protein